MIHTVEIKHAGHTFLTRFRADQIPDVRVRLAIQADREWFPFDKAFQANEQLSRIEKEHGMDMEAIKLRWTRQGFCPLILGNAEEWIVTLNHSFPTHELHRPPTGRGETLRDAFAVAEADLHEMLSKRKAKV